MVFRGVVGGVGKRTGLRENPEISVPPDTRELSDLCCESELTKYPFISAASVSEDVQSITMGGSSKDKASLYSTTQDTERRAPAVTTAPPLPIINHHPLYRNPPYYTPSLGLNGQPSYEDSGGSTHPTSATVLSRTSLDNAHRMPPDQMDEDSSITPNPDTHSLSSHFNTAVPASKMLPRDPDGGAIGRFITKEKDTEMPNSAGLKLNVRPGSETTTAAIITTMQSPGKVLD